MSDETQGGDPEQPFELLQDRNHEILMRQVHHAWLHPTTGLLLRTAFSPFPNDKGELSTRRLRLGAKNALSAKEAYDQWQLPADPSHNRKERSSVGTWGVSVEAVRKNGLRAVADAGVNDAPEHHASILFHGFDDKEIKQLARMLAAAAEQRGRMYKGKYCDCHVDAYGDQGVDSGPSENGDV